MRVVYLFYKQREQTNLLPIQYKEKLEEIWDIIKKFDLGPSFFGPNYTLGIVIKEIDDESIEKLKAIEIVEGIKITNINTIPRTHNITNTFLEVDNKKVANYIKRTLQYYGIKTKFRKKNVNGVFIYLLDFVNAPIDKETIEKIKNYFTEKIPVITEMEENAENNKIYLGFSTYYFYIREVALKSFLSANEAKTIVKKINKQFNKRVLFYRQGAMGYYICAFEIPYSPEVEKIILEIDAYGYYSKSIKIIREVGQILNKKFILIKRNISKYKSTYSVNTEIIDAESGADDIEKNEKIAYDENSVEYKIEKELTQQDVDLEETNNESENIDETKD